MQSQARQRREERKARRRLTENIPKAKKKRNKQSVYEGPECGHIISTFSVVDVEWQNGRIERDIPAISLIPYLDLMDHDFLPHDVVSDADSDRLGVILSVNGVERTCKLKWLREDGNGAEDEIHERSVYSLNEHPDLEFRLGSTVLSLARESSDPVAGLWGQIVKMQGAEISVQWENGTTTIVDPRAIYPLPDELWDGNDEGFVEFEEDGEEDDEEEEEGAEDGGPRSTLGEVASYGYRVARALGAGLGLNRIAVNVHGVDQGPDEDEEEEEGEEPHSTSASHPFPSVVPTPSSNQRTSSIQADSDDEDGSGDEEEEDREKLVAVAETLEEISSFQVEDAGSVFLAQHSFSMNPRVSPQRRFVKRVHSEWKSLRKNLPAGIYVRAFEERLDCLTAMFVGPEGTPYFAGLYHFDVFLPASYPQDPPLLRYHARGLKLHPNLYTEGKVCLSLLGTWAGRQEESWNPDSSNLQQLFLSLQGLVLGTPEPYFLEAGFEKFRGNPRAAVSSRRYNEQALLGSIRLIVRTLPSPVPIFATLTTLHFRAHSQLLCRLLEELLQPTASSLLPAQKSASAVSSSSLSSSSSSGPGLEGKVDGKASQDSMRLMQQFGLCAQGGFTPPSIGFLQVLRQEAVKLFELFHQLYQLEMPKLPPVPVATAVSDIEEGEVPPGDDSEENQVDVAQPPAETKPKKPKKKHRKKSATSTEAVGGGGGGGERRPKRRSVEDSKAEPVPMGSVVEPSGKKTRPKKKKNKVAGA
eukprot:gb/GEZN01000792.1/.p1 GENE.gb/GEZN01000792.1/~~gb/GEZN01000792.1/.p1  ORF type:complete len:753 (+),score=123.23 gb/GEZN01000792.1/:1028-3286(+)